MRSKISRRRFLRTTSTGALVSLTVPSFLRVTHLGDQADSTVKEMTLNDYYARFGVEEAVVQKVMVEALSRGGDYSDVYFQHTISNDIILEDNAVNRAFSNVDFGVGIRVLKGDQTGYSFSEEITPAAMQRAAGTAANIANDSKIIPPIQVRAHEVPDYYPVTTPWENVGIDQKIPYLQDINQQIFAMDSRIIKATIRFGNESSYVLLFTSDGRVVHDYRPMGILSISCIAEQNGRREQNSASLACRSGLEFMTPENIKDLIHEAVSKTVQLFDAVKPEAGEMEVVLAAGGSGILLHEAIGHGMEADFNRKAVSIFSDKIDKPVAENFVTIVDDGTNMNKRGSLNVDDEGNDTEKTFLVEKGILKTYLHDRISATHYNVKPTGNGRRQSFRFPPQPRMRNTYMLPGPHTRDEIIGSVKKGLYAESFTNGEVFIGAGDFTFYVKSGFLIEEGKLTKPVKDVNIIGNGPEVLKNIVMVADDLKIDTATWTCGKNGQGVPVSQGLPTVKVAKITVGGVNA